MKRLWRFLVVSLTVLWAWLRFGRALKAAEAQTVRDGEELKRLRADRAAWLGRGAKLCPVCGHLPHAMIQQRADRTLYEVGCLKCMDRRALDTTRKEAVIAWNEERFLPPRRRSS